jgi:hypothetical protein
LFQELPTAFDEEWARAFIPIHATTVAPAFIGVTEFQECFAELDEMFHALVTGSE